MSASRLLFGVTLFAVLGGPDPVRHESICLAQESTAGLSMVLTPTSPTYPLEEVSRGVVRFVAEIRNAWDHDVVVAHPSACWPGDRTSIHAVDRHGKSEILLDVTRPDGERTVLRDGPHLFEPGHVAYLRIPPNGKRQFEVAWFFTNARGRWENDEVAATLFTSQGEYVVVLVFRNSFRCTLELDRFRLVDVWTGEMRSAPVTITVK